MKQSRYTDNALCETITRGTGVSKHPKGVSLLCVSLLCMLLLGCVFLRAEEVCVPIQELCAPVQEVCMSVQEEVCGALPAEVCVPVPVDAAGGFTHEQHKQNYYDMYNAGIAYHNTHDIKYVREIEKMLLAYADLYPRLGLHPYDKSPVRGKLFWQTLNESVWLFHTAQAYAEVRDQINKKNRKKIESNLFYPMADFIENGTADNDANYRTFNKMHNHATWATAAVGLIGYAMEDTVLVRKALYGSKQDGGSGFLRQMDELFSPDGYFTEGAYYLRYAIWPFMVFAEAIDTHQPELQIFARRDSILLKAVNALIQQSYNGEILRMNDALLKTYATQEIVAAIDIAYHASHNPEWLDIARQQGSTLGTASGIETEEALRTESIVPFRYMNKLYRDGANGDQGGLALMRHGDNKTGMLVTMKATSHGLSHGHYDKLTLALYDNGREVLTDYGAARFLNVEPKSGGRYTHENETYAKQTVAHNTLVVDETSDFGGNYRLSSQYSPVITRWADTLVQAVDTAAYTAQGVRMCRTTLLLANVGTEYPIVVDVMEADGKGTHTYDMPWHYNGILIDANFSILREGNCLRPVGTHDGYQHLWQESRAGITEQNAQFTWLEGSRFYTITTTVNPQAGAEAIGCRIGANDPEQNLRSEPCMIIRQNGLQHHVFASVIEPHGVYDLIVESTQGAGSAIKGVVVEDDTWGHVRLRIEMKNGQVIPVQL